MSIKLKGSTDGSVTLQAPADTSPTGTDKTLILPTTEGSANQFVKNGGTAGELEYSSMVEDSSGKLQVNTTTIRGAARVTIEGTGNDANSSGLPLSINDTFTTSGGSSYAIAFYRVGSLVGSITTTGSATAYNTSSDYRLKENVVDLDGAITRVKQLQPKRFNFIADAETTVDGFLAHEAQTVVPEAVTGTHDQVDDDGNPVYQGIDQSKLVPLLTAALQEAIAKIETLEAKVAALEATE